MVLGEERVRARGGGVGLERRGAGIRSRGENGLDTNG